MVDAIGMDPNGNPSNEDRTLVDRGFAGCPGREPQPDPSASAYTNGVVTPHAAFLGLRSTPGETLDNLRRPRGRRPQRHRLRGALDAAVAGAFAVLGGPAPVAWGADRPAPGAPGQTANRARARGPLHEVQLVDRRSLTYRQVSTACSGRWRITKTYAPPYSSTSAGESRDRDDLAFGTSKRFAVEPGDFDVWVSTSSEGGRKGSFTVTE